MVKFTLCQICKNKRREECVGLFYIFKNDDERSEYDEFDELNICENCFKECNQLFEKAECKECFHNDGCAECVEFGLCEPINIKQDTNIYFPFCDEAILHLKNDEKSRLVLTIMKNYSEASAQLVPQSGLN